MANHTRTVVQGSTFYFLGAVLAAGIAYLTKLMLVRTLTVEEYGLFFSVFTFVLLFSVFRELGITQGLGRFIAEYNLKKKFDELTAIIIGSAAMQFLASGVIVVLMWIASEWLATYYFRADEAKWLLRIVSLYLPIHILFSNTKAIFQGVKANTWFAASDPIRNTLVLGGIIVALFFGAGIYAPAIAYVLAPIAFFALTFTALVKHTHLGKYRYDTTIEQSKQLLIFSLPLILTTAGATFINYFDTLMLTYFYTVVEVGVYNIIYPTAMLFAVLGGSVGLVLLPVLTELWEQKKKHDIVQAFAIIQQYLFLLFVPAVIIISLFSGELIALFFGREYVIGQTAFIILLIAGVLSVLVSIYQKALIAIKQPKKIMNIYVIGAVSNIILNIILIPAYSLTGAAIASTTSFFIMTILALHYLRKFILIRIPIKQLFITLALGGVIPVAIYAIRTIFVQVHPVLISLIGTIIGGGIYIAGILFFGLASVSKIRYVLKR